jgi:hypothetical protein
MKRIINFVKRKLYIIPKKEIIDPLETDSPFDGTQKISEFIREAINDIDSVIKHGYGLNMEDWITNCEVCLGGAVLLNRFNVRSREDVFKYDSAVTETTSRLEDVARLFDQIRMGNKSGVSSYIKVLSKRSINNSSINTAVQKWKPIWATGQCNPEDIFLLKQSVYDLANCLQVEGL